jgi:hypothetical protein
MERITEQNTHQLRNMFFYVKIVSRTHVTVDYSQACTLGLTTKLGASSKHC